MFKPLKGYWQQNGEDCTIYSLSASFGIVIILILMTCSPILAVIMAFFLGALLKLWWNDFRKWRSIYGGGDE